jgi:hypothetical protein
MGCGAATKVLITTRTHYDLIVAGVLRLAQKTCWWLLRAAGLDLAGVMG